jgi:NAD(P)-dependent dehydrogenase (short-subunit alcohol dehydrogenase family)
MARELRNSVVVITGASSGIGRAVAMGFARRGARLVLASRGPEALEQVVDECRRRGAEAVGVPTDISDESQVEALAQRTFEHYGQMDVWVNCAAVVAFGRFLDVPAQSFRRVLDTNLFGLVHGARVALKHFLRQNSGVFIEVASVLGKEGIPYLSSYVASKEACIGLAACLRVELQGSGVRVCTVLPASIDTPIWEHGANYTGKAVMPIRPVYDPEDVSQAIVSCAVRPRRIVYVGVSGRFVTYAHNLAPGLYERTASSVVERALFQRGMPAQHSDGNLFEASSGHYVRGGWQTEEPSRWPRALAVAAGLMSAATIGWWLRPRRTPRARAGKALVQMGKKLAA